MRKTLALMILGLLVTGVTGCSSPERSKARAEADLAKEKTKTMQEYKACLKKAGNDQEKLDACERIVKAIPPN